MNTTTNYTHQSPINSTNKIEQNSKVKTLMKIHEPISYTEKLRLQGLTTSKFESLRV